MLRQRLSEPQYKDLNRLFSVWVGRVIMRNMDIPESSMPVFQNLQEVENMLAETVASWKDAWIAEGRMEGMETGLSKGRMEGCAEGRLRYNVWDGPALSDYINNTYGI